MKKLCLTFLFLSHALTSFGQTVVAHTIEAELTETLGIAILTDLVSQDAVSNPFVFDQPNEFSNGITVNSGAIFSINASVNWQVAFKSNSANFSNIGSTATMPLSILELKETVGGSFAALSQSNRVLASGPPVMNLLSSVQTFTVDYKITPGTGYPAEEYSSTITYTVSGQ